PGEKATAYTGPLCPSKRRSPSLSAAATGAFGSSSTKGAGRASGCPEETAALGGVVGGTGFTGCLFLPRSVPARASAGPGAGFSGDGRAPQASRPAGRPTTPPPPPTPAAMRGSREGLERDRAPGCSAASGAAFALTGTGRGAGFGPVATRAEAGSSSRGH